MTNEALQLQLGASLTDANKLQSENRTREMSLVITKIEEAQLWLSKLQ